MLKIDRAFIRNLDSDAESMPIVQTIIALTHALGCKVVAEGVETEAQAKLLRGMRCDQYQGYLSSKPPPWHFARCLKQPLAVPVLKAYCPAPSR